MRGGIIILVVLLLISGCGKTENYSGDTNLNDSSEDGTEDCIPDGGACVREFDVDQSCYDCCYGGFYSESSGYYCGSKYEEEEPEEPEINDSDINETDGGGIDEPACYWDEECGNPTYDLYCDDDSVWKETITPTCFYPMMPEAFCENIIGSVFVEECPYGCDNATCLNESG